MKKYLSLLLVVVLILSIFVGCKKDDNKPTPQKNPENQTPVVTEKPVVKELTSKEILTKSKEAMENVKSLSLGINSDINIKATKDDVDVSFPIKIALSFDLIKEPMAVKMLIDLNVANQAQTISAYVIQDGDKTYSYTYDETTEKFIREEVLTEEKQTDPTEILNKIFEEYAGWDWEKEENDNSYVLKHTMNASDMQKLIEILKNFSEEEQAVDMDVDLSEVKEIPIAITVDKETFQVKELSFDLSKLIDDLMQSLMGMADTETKIEISNSTIVIKISNVNKVDKIEAPENWVSADDVDIDPITPDYDYEKRLNEFAQQMQTELSEADPSTIYSVTVLDKDIILEMSSEGLDEYINSEAFAQDEFQQLEEDLLTGLVYDSLKSAMDALELSESKLYIRIVSDSDSNKIYAESCEGVITYDFTTDPTNPPVNPQKNYDGKSPLGKVDVPFKFNDKQMNFNTVTKEDFETLGFKDRYSDDPSEEISAYDSVLLSYALPKDDYNESEVMLYYYNNTRNTATFEELTLESVSIKVGDPFEWDGVYGSMYGDTFEVLGVTSGMSYEEIKSILGEGEVSYVSDNYQYTTYLYTLENGADLSLSVSDTVGAFEFEIQYYE